jgi:hypothetical protein
VARQPLCRNCKQPLHCSDLIWKPPYLNSLTAASTCPNRYNGLFSSKYNLSHKVIIADDNAIISHKWHTTSNIEWRQCHQPFKESQSLSTLDCPGREADSPEEDAMPWKAADLRQGGKHCHISFGAGLVCGLSTLPGSHKEVNF